MATVLMVTVFAMTDGLAPNVLKHFVTYVALNMVSVKMAHAYVTQDGMEDIAHSKDVPKVVLDTASVFNKKAIGLVNVVQTGLVLIALSLSNVIVRTRETMIEMV